MEIIGLREYSRPGTLGFSLGTRNSRSPETFSILRIERAGIVQPRNLTIKAGENLTDITIILSYGTAAIRGSVKTENGALPQGAQFGIWIKKLGETGDSNSYPRTFSDVRGHFLIERLAAGTYELSVNVNIPGGRPLPPVKRVVTVSEAATVEVEVTLDLKSNPEQLPQP